MNEEDSQDGNSSMGVRVDTENQEEWIEGVSYLSSSNFSYRILNEGVDIHGKDQMPN
jgi:hypothetical protein